MKESMLNPMGMKDSFFTQPPADTQELATGYWFHGKVLEGKYHIKNLSLDNDGGAPKTVQNMPEPNDDAVYVDEKT